MALHHALWLGQMAPDSNISLRWFWTSSTKGGGICLNHSLKGVSFVTLIICSVEWVQPNSTGSKVKTSWYLARSWQAASASSRGHKFNLLKFNSINSLPCLCLVVKLSGWGSWGPSSPSHTLISSGVSSTTIAATALATGAFFSECLGVGCTVPYQHKHILATFLQLSVCILDGKTLG